MSVQRVGRVVVAEPDPGSDLHSVLARALDFPAHYGRNLDALADCLRDVDVDTVLVWRGWSELAAADPRTFDVALELLADRITVLLPA